MSRNLPYNRADRVGEQAYQIIATHLYEELDDERLSGIQLTSVKITKDLSIARIYYYIDGDAERKEICRDALEKKKGYFRCLLAKEMVLKSVPRVEFYLDEGYEAGEKLEVIFKEIKEKSKADD